MQNSVQARINGRDITFQIEPEHVHGFESYIGKSAYEMLRAFTHGVWTVKDVKNVLTFALFADRLVAEGERRSLERSPRQHL